MLHIATPLYRYTYLESIYNTIPKAEDITWHLAKSKHRLSLDLDFVNDPRIKIYEIDCMDNDVEKKRNVIFDNIKDGFFFLLDDDTVFLEEAYKVYSEINEQQFIGMAIGNQKFFNNSCYIKRKYPSENPARTFLDSGMVICHSSVLTKVRWKAVDEYRNDSYFWSNCYNYFGRNNTLLVDKYISLYNYFGPKIRMKKQFLFWKIRMDIYHPLLVKIYLQTSGILNFFRLLFSIKRKNRRFPYSN